MGRCRTAIDWSYQLLDAQERDLFCRLAVFAGRFGLDAVEAILDGSVIGELDVIDVVDRLADKSIVVADTSGPRPLYALLESLRDYGQERLVSGDRVRRAHAEFHGRLVRRLIHQLRTDRIGSLDFALAAITAADQQPTAPPSPPTLRPRSPNSRPQPARPYPQR